METWDQTTRQIILASTKLLKREYEKESTLYLKGETFLELLYQIVKARVYLCIHWRVWNSESSGMYCCDLKWMSTEALIMEAARTSETSVDIQLRTRQYIPEDSELHTCRRENLKSHTEEQFLTVHIDYSRSVSGASVNVEGFKGSAINCSHGLERFAAVSVELSVHTGKSPRASAARARTRVQAWAVRTYL
jgi:hypothetical protein